MRLTYRVWTLLTIALVAGCSGSDDAEDSEEDAGVETTMVSTQPGGSDGEKSGGASDEAAEFGGPFAENLNFFSPPKMIMSMEEDDEVDLTGDLPPLRLVGFVGAAGDKAMVTVEGKMYIVTAGRRLSGIEIVSVESPKMALRWGETELTLDFYKPIKSNRTVRKVEPTLTFSQRLSKMADSKKGRSTSIAKPKGERTRKTNAVPPLPTALPLLPNLLQPGAIPGTNLSGLPDSGSGTGARPAP